MQSSRSQTSDLASSTGALFRAEPEFPLGTFAGGVRSAIGSQSSSRPTSSLAIERVESKQGGTCQSAAKCHTSRRKGLHHQRRSSLAQQVARQRGGQDLGKSCSSFRSWCSSARRSC